LGTLGWAGRWVWRPDGQTEREERHVVRFLQRPFTIKPLSNALYNKLVCFSVSKTFSIV
jgi:hypothetical protein